MSAARPRVPLAVWMVVFGGVAAALHVGKLPPAVVALQAALHISLVEAGFLLSLVQFAGMGLGLVAGLAADAIGLRRCMLLGLALLSAASVLSSLAASVPHAVGWLLGWRAVEGLGFLMASMPGPALVRRLAPAGADKAAMGLWGAFMPTGVALALLVGPWVIGAGAWPVWWWGCAALSALAALLILRLVPADPPRVLCGAPATNGSAAPAGQRLRRTVAGRSPWLLALGFGVYSSQWIAVIGFLPTIYAETGWPSALTAGLTAVAAALNIVGNVGGGRLLQHGWPPERLLRLGFAAMGLASFAAFVQASGAGGTWALPLEVRYVAVCLFSLSGGMVPTTLFTLAARLAPSPDTVSTTVGLMQQGSSFGQFIAPPVVAWLAHQVGGWQWTWLATVGCCLVGLWTAGRLARQHKEHDTP